MKTESEESVYDKMLIPTLRAAKLSRGRGDITEADERYVLEAIREIVEDLGDRRESTNAAVIEAGGYVDWRQSTREVARRSRSSAARPTTRRIEPPWKCSRICSTRAGGIWR